MYSWCKNGTKLQAYLWNDYDTYGYYRHMDCIHRKLHPQIYNWYLCLSHRNAEHLLCYLVDCVTTMQSHLQMMEIIEWFVTKLKVTVIANVGFWGRFCDASIFFFHKNGFLITKSKLKNCILLWKGQLKHNGLAWLLILKLSVVNMRV